MKKIVAVLLTFLLFSGCMKDSLSSLSISKVIPPNDDHIGILLEKDSLNSFNNVGVILQIEDNVPTTYTKNDDAPYFPGFGKESLWLLSSDNVSLSIYELPYTQGMTIPLVVKSTSSSVMFLKLDNVVLPKEIHIFLNDHYTNQTFELTSENYYKFNVDFGNQNTSGPGRFSITLKQL
jgi:hypothetical protein